MDFEAFGAIGVAKLLGIDGQMAMAALQPLFLPRQQYEILVTAVRHFVHSANGYATSCNDFRPVATSSMPSRESVSAF